MNGQYINDDIILKMLSNKKNSIWNYEYKIKGVFRDWPINCTLKLSLKSLYSACYTNVVRITRSL